jgi:hypothetical protein
MDWLSEEFLKEHEERVRNMSDEEVIESLKRAGILDEEGELTERYRPPEAGSEADLELAKKLGQLSVANALATLRHAGIVDADGNLTPSYRPLTETRAKKSTG